MKKIVAICVLISLVLMLSGCALLFTGGKAEMNVTSDPEGAEVWVNGVSYGKTPVKFKLKTNQKYTFEFKKEGYKPEIRVIENKIGVGWVILDVLAGLAPVIVDVYTGAWYVLDQKNVDAQLERQQPKP